MSDVYMIGEASADESGEFRDGLLGDQNGIELRCRRWYKHDPIWGKVYRFTDPEVAEKIASNMEKAIANGCVGYDTNHRHRLLMALQEVDFEFDRVLTPVTTDCSALVYACVRGATGIDYDSSYTEYPEIMPLLTQVSPKVKQFDMYLERTVLINGDYDMTVFTIRTSSETETEGSVAVNFADGTTRYYTEPYYDTPFDYYDEGKDDEKVGTNLHMIYLNEENEYGYTEDFLNTFLTIEPSGSPETPAWKRGDIIRTISKLNYNGTYTGHIVVFL